MIRKPNMISDGHHVKITTIGEHTSIELDGMRLKCVQRCDLISRPDNVAGVTITFFPSSIAFCGRANSQDVTEPAHYDMNGTPLHVGDYFDGHAPGQSKPIEILCFEHGRIACINENGDIDRVDCSDVFLYKLAGR